MKPVSRKRPFALVQREVIGATDPATGMAEEAEISLFSALDSDRNWQDHLCELDRHLQRDRVLTVHVSIQVADFIRRACPALSRGLSYRPAALRHSNWSSLVPLQVQLNRSYVLVPFGMLAARAGDLELLFGERILLRPDSSRKVFPGMTCRTRDLAETVSMIRQTHRLTEDELVLVDRAREIDPVEYRFWLADGAIVTRAGYTFGPDGQAPGVAIPPCPRPLVELAESLASIAPMIETIDPLLVADLVMEGDQPRLVELNAWSTSGFYPGADLAAIARAGICAAGACTAA